MRRFLALLAFLLLTLTFLPAQGNGNGCGNNGNSNSPWAGYWPNYVITWLENGGQIPFPLAVAVIHEAREWGRENFGLNQGQMIGKYMQGQLTIEYIPTAPPSLTFRLAYGGLDILVLTDF